MDAAETARLIVMLAREREGLATVAAGRKPLNDPHAPLLAIGDCRADHCFSGLLFCPSERFAAAKLEHAI